MGVTDAGRRRARGRAPWLSLGVRCSPGARRPFRAEGRHREPRPEAGATGLFPLRPAGCPGLPLSSLREHDGTCDPPFGRHPRVASVPPPGLGFCSYTASISKRTLGPPRRNRVGPQICAHRRESDGHYPSYGDETVLLTGQSALGPDECDDHSVRSGQHLSSCTLLSRDKLAGLKLVF